MDRYWRLSYRRRFFRSSLRRENAIIVLGTFAFCTSLFSLMKNEMRNNGKHSTTDEKTSTDSTFSTTDYAGTVPEVSCPEMPDGLVGHLHTNESHTGKDLELIRAVEIENHDLNDGGSWFPKHCRSHQSFALIIPYRNRAEHLAVLLGHLHRMMKRQLLRYTIFVVEQDGTYPFNKARLMNIAYDCINKTRRPFVYDCFIFHDVDLVPENDYNFYRCEENPRHLSPAVNTLNYTLKYKELVGGVLALTSAVFEQVNGYSNLYCGWGGEDDDMYYRLEAENLTISRSSASVGRYHMLHHNESAAYLVKKRKFRLVWSAHER